ncbi:iron-containing alcohol dehydrogenase [Acinetobacter sp. A3.8]|uniref:Iron-containing alcohol dehydrogenase n=1 Tax=Acinetobacter sedimenti TaxID=2919922 RepID=A0A9X1WWN8_9GAMM|nr:iron-containing alcohol dehydrogenase [Acinetobacter sedimenti]MCJ8146539.1 iron-containing alcohol dehydrogenase [Acinetobacter sedimenti]
MSGFVFQTVSNLIVGIDSLSQMNEECRRLNMRNIMVVTDHGLVAQGIAKQVTDQIQTNYQLYTDVQADPPEHVVLSAVEFAKQSKVDGVIGLGGGSAMDVAKLIAVLAHPKQSQSLQSMYGVNQVQAPRLPLIQIPTTAGTGSEVTPIAIVTTGETTKSGVVSPILYADTAILDASLTVNLPTHITAATGIDAMVHAIESYTSKHKKNPYSDLLAIQALKLLNQALPVALKFPQDLEARQQMLFGAMLAGQAFANAPVAAVHALAYPLGGHCHLSHGHSNALVLCEVLKFNAPVTETLYAELMQAINPNAKGSTSELCQQFINHMQNICAQSGLKLKLSELDIAEDLLDTLAHDAMLQTRLLQNNPRELSETDALAIYHAVF